MPPTEQAGAIPRGPTGWMPPDGPTGAMPPDGPTGAMPPTEPTGAMPPTELAGLTRRPWRVESGQPSLTTWLSWTI
jgi:hypothetical protein